MESSEVKSLLGIIVSVYPSMEITKERILVWEELLRDEDFNDLRGAALHYLKSSHEFPPTPGQLIQGAKDDRNAMARARAKLEEERRRVSEPYCSDEQREKNLKWLRNWLEKTASSKSIQ
jgi:hypothetical protein